MGSSVSPTADVELSVEPLVESSEQSVEPLAEPFVSSTANIEPPVEPSLVSPRKPSFAAMVSAKLSSEASGAEATTAIMTPCKVTKNTKNCTRSKRRAKKEVQISNCDFVDEELDEGFPELTGRTVQRRRGRK